MRIACLFGTFDPPHRGHVGVARAVLLSGLADRVWLVVTPRSPFKPHQRISPDTDRVHMVRLALAGEEGMEASDAELFLPRPNYTAHTLACFRKRWPRHTFILVIGEDNMAGFHRWHEPEEILRHHELLVYPRAGASNVLMDGPYAGHPHIQQLRGVLLDVSATAIREAVASGTSIHGLVHPAVERYIQERGLYKG